MLRGQCASKKRDNTPEQRQCAVILFQYTVQNILPYLVGARIDKMVEPPAHRYELKIAINVWCTESVASVVDIYKKLLTESLKIHLTLTLTRRMLCTLHDKLLH